MKINHIKGDHPRYAIVYIPTANSGKIYEKHMPRSAVQDHMPRDIFLIS